MKFNRITNEFCGARNAGYTFDPAFDREIDLDIFQEIICDRGESFANGMIDSLTDLEGDLFQGDDGNFYAVEFDWGKNPPAPVAWRRLKEEG